MNPTRKIAVITGVLFILATLAGPLLATPLTPDLTGRITSPGSRRT